MDDALFGQIYNLIRGSKLKKSVTHILPQSLLSLTDWLRLGQDWIDWRSNLSLSTSTLLIRIKQTGSNPNGIKVIKNSQHPGHVSIQCSEIIEKKRPSNWCHWHCFCQPMLVLPPSHPCTYHPLNTVTHFYIKEYNMSTRLTMCLGIGWSRVVFKV